MKGIPSEGRREEGLVLTLAHIAEQWIKKLVLGQIRYDPCKVQSRWIMSANNPGKFQAILNGNRKDRLEKRLLKVRI